MPPIDPFEQAGREMAARNAQRLSASQAAYRQQRSAGMRPGTNAEQQFEMFGPGGGAGGDSAAEEELNRKMQGRMQMESRNRELQRQKEMKVKAARSQVDLTAEQRAAEAARLGLTPDRAETLRTRQDLHTAEMQNRREARQKAIAVGDVMRKYGPQLMASGVTEDQLSGSYDDGNLNLHRIRSQAIRDGQGWINHQQQASDQSLANNLRRGHGPGIVARSLRNARTWEDRLAAASIADPVGTARAASMPDAPPPEEPPPMAIDELKAAMAHVQTLPPGMREAALAVLLGDPEQAKALAQGMNEAEGVAPRSGWNHVIDWLVPDGLWNWATGQGQPPPAPQPGASAMSNPAGRATGYTDPRSVAMGRTAGKILPGLMG